MIARALFVCALLASSATWGQSVPDLAFDVTVARPANRDAHPRVVIDEAHFNFHTSDARYRPFAELLRNDGYAVIAGAGKFTPDYLLTLDVLVISNARGAAGPPDSAKDAFTAAECAAVDGWVRQGGRLLLIADHAPFGASARSLAEIFGVQMGNGHVFDPVNSGDESSFLVFAGGNGLLAKHAITRGRNPAERVRVVVTFEGQSLSVPHGAVALLRLGKGAAEAQDVQQLEAASGTAVRGRAQGVALTHGQGRVVIMGEAALFTAQILPDRENPEMSLRFGMNAPGNDDRQFALNVMRWLSGAL
jgi:hypothetical protein